MPDNFAFGSFDFCKLILKLNGYVFVSFNSQCVIFEDTLRITRKASEDLYCSVLRNALGLAFLFLRACSRSPYFL